MININIFNCNYRDFSLAMTVKDIFFANFA